MDSDIYLRNKIKRGISSSAFIKTEGEKEGYRIFDAKTRIDHFAGNIVVDNKKHGIYFTVDKKEIFRFLMCASLEDFGDSLAVISFRDKKGHLIKNAHITKGYDTKGTFRTHKFYIKQVCKLDDYKLVSYLYDIAYPSYQMLIYDDSEGGFYHNSLLYFEKKGMNNMVKALKDIHQKEVAKMNGI